MTASAPVPAMTKREAMAFLGKSARSIESYVTDGKLAVHYINGSNGREARFKTEDVERLKADMETPAFRAVPAQAQVTQALVRIADAPDEAAKTLAPLAQAIAAAVSAGLRGAEPKPWLTLAEAAEYSGLPKSFLLAYATSSLMDVEDELDVSLGTGSIRVINVGTEKKRVWRFSRESLGK